MLGTTRDFGINFESGELIKIQMKEGLKFKGVGEQLFGLKNFSFHFLNVFDGCQK